MKNLMFYFLVSLSIFQYLAIRVQAQVLKGKSPIAQPYPVSFDDNFAAQEHYLDDEKIPPAGKEEDYYSTSAITDYAVRFLKEHQERISTMKKRWEELNEIYQKQGKEGLNEDK